MQGIACSTGSACQAGVPRASHVLLAMGRDLPDLHLIYGLMPIGISFVAEQLRIAGLGMLMAGRGRAA